MKFTGNYVKTIRAVLRASVLSGQHALLLGGPGMGKTRMTVSAAHSIYGEQHVSFRRLSPSTSTEELRGPYDIAKLIDPVKPSMERVLHGTPYDPSVKLIVIDELSRASDVIFDVLLDVLDRVDTTSAPPVWSTANFAMRGTRVEALLDRIALWHWLPVQPEIDVEQMVSAHLNGNASFDSSDMPTREQIDMCRTVKPSQQAVTVVSEAMRALVDAAVREGIVLHPRRLVQVSRVVFATSMCDAGAADFTSIGATTREAVEFCAPAPKSDQDQAIWRDVCDVLQSKFDDSRLVCDLIDRYAQEFSRIRDTVADQDLCRRQMVEVMTRAQVELREMSLKSRTFLDAVGRLRVLSKLMPADVKIADVA
jgi:MoxR-like ATPase